MTQKIGFIGLGIMGQLMAFFQLYRQGLGLGNGDLDFAAVKKTLEALNDQ